MNKSVILCAGPGGVGKTTQSATVALALARSGKKVVVLTIDPAKRLAEALGFRLGNDAVRVEHPLLESCSGELYGAMLDPVETLDALMRHSVDNDAQADALINNRIYQQLTRSLTGTLEYAAVEKLYDLHRHFDFDVVVVDTPPSQNVLDFIEAPTWLGRFFDERILKWFSGDETKKMSLSARLASRGGRVVWDMLGKIFGDTFTVDIREFFAALGPVSRAINQRAQAIDALLKSDDTACLVVTTTQENVMRDAAELKEAMTDAGIHFGGFIVNRTHPDLGTASWLKTEKELAGLGPQNWLDDSLKDELENLLEHENKALRRDREAIAKLRRWARWSGQLAVVPRQVNAVSDVPALLGLSDYLGGANFLRHEPESS